MRAWCSWFLDEGGTCSHWPGERYRRTGEASSCRRFAAPLGMTAFRRRMHRRSVYVMRSKSIVLLSAGVLAWAPTCRAQATRERADLAVRAARVLDIRTGRYDGPTVVLVSGTRISRVIPARQFDARDAARTIDLGDMTLVPGFIDAHVHLAIGGPVRANALADLRAGFTTVADQGALTHRLLVLRDSMNAGHIEGPRVLAAGIWVGSKGGVCEFTGIGIAGGAEAFVQRVRENIAAGANLTKVCLSSWPAASYAAPDSVEIPRDVLRAIVRSEERR